MKNEIEIPVEWGDTDQAAIVFYPNYFRWFDIGTRHLLDAAGMPYATLSRKFGLLGLPLVEAGSRFLKPVRFGDTVRLASAVAAWRRKTVRIDHLVSVGGTLCAEGHEIRAVAREDNGRIEAVSPPDALVAALPVQLSSV